MKSSRWSEVKINRSEMWGNKKVMLMVKFPELAMTCEGGEEVEIIRPGRQATG